MNRAVFLDRDGTINVDKKYLYHVSDFEYIPGAIDALCLLQETGYLLVIVTNQSGIARGYYTEEDLVKLSEWLLRDLKRAGVLISGFYYCPHHPEAAIPKYRIDCDCRKPQTGLFFRAAKELNIDLDTSFAVGDRMRDLSICKASGCKGYLVGDSLDAKLQLPTNITIASDLYSVAKDIVQKK